MQCYPLIRFDIHLKIIHLLNNIHWWIINSKQTIGVELTWNYGTENEEGMFYNTGNADTTGTADGSKIRGG